jgi:hypothetical protein
MSSPQAEPPAQALGESLAALAAQMRSEDLGFHQVEFLAA